MLGAGWPLDRFSRVGLTFLFTRWGCVLCRKSTLARARLALHRGRNTPHLRPYLGDILSVP